ncbi:hypothetical protein GW17_00013266 [Ensete ventricosum]|nr:hypothetical protein GW17_00013266 [Ensete ventricosum]
MRKVTPAVCGGDSTVAPGDGADGRYLQPGERTPNLGRARTGVAGQPQPTLFRLNKEGVEKGSGATATPSVCAGPLNVRGPRRMRNSLGGVSGAGRGRRRNPPKPNKREWRIDSSAEDGGNPLFWSNRWIYLRPPTPVVVCEMETPESGMLHPRRRDLPTTVNARGPALVGPDSRQL